MEDTPVFSLEGSARKVAGKLKDVSFAVFLATTVAFSTVSVAEAVSPTKAEPQKIDKRFEKKKLEPYAPKTPIPGMPIAQPSAGADLVEFNVNNIKLSGSTIYSEDELMVLIGDVEGKSMTLADAQRIAGAITRKYRVDGYILSQAAVSQNDVKEGLLHIRVNEGYISKVIIEGEHRGGRGIIEGYARKIEAARPLNVKVLERYLLLTDDLPGVTAKGVMRPSATEPGASELVIVMAHKSYSGSATVDNRGTEFQGPEQYSAQFTANSVLGMYERTQVRGITTTPSSELRFIDIQHEQQVGSDGTRLLLVGSITDSNPGDVLGPLDIEGESRTFRVRALHPFMRSRKENLFGRVSFDYRNAETDILGVLFSEDRIRSVRIGMQYDFMDSLRGINLLDVELSRGLDIMNATDSSDSRSRSDGEEDATKIALSAARLQNFSGGWSVLAQASGQYAFDPLLSAEEFSIGGAGFGRAYDPSELAADHGAAAKVEVRWGNAPNKEFLQSYQLYGFYDIGAVWNKDAPAGTDDRSSLASTGAGFRANMNKHLSSNFELGLPLTRNVASNGDQGMRAFFSVTGRF